MPPTLNNATLSQLSLGPCCFEKRADREEALADVSSVAEKISDAERVGRSTVADALVMEVVCILVDCLSVFAQFLPNVIEDEGIFAKRRSQAEVIFI